MRSRSPLFMVYTAVPPDYCDNDVAIILQQAPSGVNSPEKERLGNDEGNLSEEPFGLAQVGGVTVVLRLRIEVGEDADAAAKNVHGRGRLRQGPEQIA